MIITYFFYFQKLFKFRKKKATLNNPKQNSNKTEFNKFFFIFAQKT